MLLPDEQHIVKWLSQYGPLARAQVIRMLQKPEDMAEKIIGNLLRIHMIEEQADGRYLGLSAMDAPNHHMLAAVWVLLEYIDQINPMAHYPATYPAQIYFLKNETGYEIAVFTESELHLAKLLQPQSDTRYIIVIPDISMASLLKLPDAPAIFATIDRTDPDASRVLFYTPQKGDSCE